MKTSEADCEDHPKEKPKRTPAQEAAALANLEKAKAAKEAKVEESEQPYSTPEEDGAPGQLQVMRHVFLNPRRFDRTPAQKQVRKFQEKRPHLFNSQLNQMEREHRAAVESRVDQGAEIARLKAEVERLRPVASGGPDVGTQRCLELCEKLLGGG